MPTAEAIRDQVRDYIAAAAGTREWNDTRDAWIARGAHRLGLEFGRAKSLFYRKVVNVPAYEWELIRARLAAMDARDAERARDRAAIERMARRL